MSEWQPIETAPHNLPVLVYVPPHVNDGQNKGRRLVAVQFNVWGWLTQPGRYAVNPTRWMMLPERPE